MANIKTTTNAERMKEKRNTYTLLVGMYINIVTREVSMEVAPKSSWAYIERNVSHHMIEILAHTCLLHHYSQ
jgi:hypothetical protein